MYRRSTALLTLALAASVLSLAGCAFFGGAPSLDGTSWVLTGWSAKDLDPARYEITVEFDEGRIGGHAPVNSWGGAYRAGAGGELRVKDVVSTLMAGPEPAMRAESAFFARLEQARGYALDGGRLVLRDGKGRELLVFAARP